MAGALNIAALTRRTGVPSDTIRKWEQRYGVLNPARTPGGQRRYSEIDVARVEWLKARLGEGYRIGAAAALLGNSETIAMSADDLRVAVVAATVRSEVVTLERLIDQALAIPSLESSFFDVIAPALVEVGERWATGEATVAQEHLCTGVIRAGLQRLIADARPGVRGTAVLACAPGEHHDVGLLMLAVLLRADGWQVAYLGADTPTRDALDLATGLGARVVCFSAGSRAGRTKLDRSLASEGVPADLRVVVGGRTSPACDLQDVRAELRQFAA